MAKATSSAFSTSWGRYVNLGGPKDWALNDTSVFAKEWWEKDVK